MRATGKISHHEVVDRNTADTTEPALHVSQTNVQVLPDTVLSDATRDVGVQEVVGGDAHILTAHEQLVGGRHVLVKHLRGDGGQSRVGNPGTVVTGTHFTELVGANTLHGLVVGGRVVLDRNLSGHTTLPKLAYVPKCSQGNQKGKVP